MRPTVCLLLVLAAIARAATIPAPAETHVEKVAAEVIKDLNDKDLNVASEPELLDQSNIIKDVDNKLRKQIAENPIPVKVVVEDVKPALKASDEKKDCDKVVDDDDSGIKRVEIDLKHPGEPQRQEHETQNPEPVDSENVAVTKIKQMIQDTQLVFNSNFKSITDGINNWIQDHEPEVSIKDSIDNLQGTFMEQINKLNSTIQTYWNPEAVEDSQKQANIKDVESGLKVLEENFESGVETLSNGVEFLAVLKSGVREDSSTSTAASAPSNPFLAFVTTFQSTLTQNFGNLTSHVQNLLNQGNNSTVAGAQSDEGVSTTRPSVWQGIQNSIQGLIRPGQSQQQGAQNDSPAPSSSGPFAQVIQNNPFVQSVINFIQPKPQQGSGAAQPEKPADNTSEGSNAVPASDEKPAADEQKVKPEVQPAQAQPGPIQQIIQKNPIVQGIAGAVQRIQHTVNNPEKPRDEPPAPAQEGEKGGFLLHGGHGGHKPSDGNNNNVNSSGSAVVKRGEPILEAEKIPEEKEKVEEEEKTPAEAVKQD